MNTNLWAIRLKSVGLNLLGIVITAVVGYFMSDDFAHLLHEYTGTATWGTVITLLVSEAFKHWNNVRVVGKLGAAGGPKILV